MKIAVEILLIWTSLDVVIGIPIWLLIIKFRDHQEEAAGKAVGFAHTAYLTGVRPSPSHSEHRGGKIRHPGSFD
jgi:hypothetical protein